MATHTKVRTSWLANQPVLHGEFAALDFGQFDSISASGGTYAPAAIITIGGMGIVISGPAEFTGATSFQDNSVEFLASSVILDSITPFTAHGTADFDGSAFTVSAPSAFSGASGFTAPVSIGTGGSLTLNGTAALVCNYHATFNDTTTFTSNTAFTNSVTISGIVGFSAPMIPSGSGQIISRIVFGGDSSSLPPFSKSLADVCIIEDTVLTAARTYVLDSVGAQSGSVFTFRKDTGSHDVEIRASGGALICTLSNTPAAGFRWVDLIYTTQWELLRYQAA